MAHHPASPFHFRRGPSTATTAPRSAAVRAALSPLGTPRAQALLRELALSGAPVPEVVLDTASTVTGVLVTLHEVETNRAAAGGVYTVRDDATVEVVGAWSSSSATAGLRRRVLWELEAEARRRGFSQAVATATLEDDQLSVLVAAGYTSTRHDAAGEPARGKSLTRR